jgi:hypothetical protein
MHELNVATKTKTNLRDFVLYTVNKMYALNIVTEIGIIYTFPIYNVTFSTMSLLTYSNALKCRYTSFNANILTLNK